MQKVEFLGKKVGVEKTHKPSKREGLFVAEPDVADDFGVVRYIGTEVQNAGFQVGDSVYFGKNREELRMAGKDILVMEASNVLAKIIEEA